MNFNSHELKEPGEKGVVPTPWGQGREAERSRKVSTLRVMSTPPRSADSGPVYLAGKPQNAENLEPFDQRLF